jgi:hypothetical protein
MGDIFTYVAPTTILSVIPATGPTVGGIPVLITGIEFRYGATVTFGGNSATAVVIQSENYITCTIPAHAAGAENVVVTNLSGTGGTATLTNGFTYYLAAPTVTAVQPPTGDIAGGEAIIITGTGFGATPSVLMGGAAATSEVLIDANHLSCITPAHAAGIVDVDVTNPDTQFSTLFGGYTFTDPSIYVTDTEGWWYSIDGFAGGTDVVLSPNHPHHARTWANIAAFAAAGAGMLGGSPAASVMYRNYLIYAASDYSTGNPTIRMFDGLADRILATVPNTTAAAVPKAIISMLLVGDLIYFSTLDTGTTAADFTGRVFVFNPLSSQMAMVATGFTSGEVPYALAYHMNRLWVGTNKSSGAGGKIYFFRPGIDSTWTTDYTLSSSTVGGACSLCSFNGYLMVGTDNVAGSFAKVLIRDGVGAYVDSTTLAGGTAAANNGFLQMIEFKSNLYATSWNPDATAVAYVKKYTGASTTTVWSTVYTGSALTLRPYILMFIANDYLYVVGGGNGLRASLIRTSDGTTWTDLTAYLAGPITETAIPLFGVVHA